MLDFEVADMVCGHKRLKKGCEFCELEWDMIMQYSWKTEEQGYLLKWVVDHKVVDGEVLEKERRCTKRR